MADYSNQPSVNTYSLSFFNDDKIMMKIIFFNDSLTVNICIPTVEGGKTTYPKDNRHSVVLKPRDVVAIHQLIMDEVLPAYSQGKAKDVGVFTNRDKTQMFEAVTTGGELYVVIHDKIANRVPAVSYMFKFNKVDIVKNYNIEAVSCDIEQIDAEFALFVKILESFADMCSGITAHEEHMRYSYFMDTVKSYLNAFNTKFNLGLGKGYSSSANSGFDQDFNTPVGNNPVEVINS